MDRGLRAGRILITYEGNCEGAALFKTFETNVVQAVEGFARETEYLARWPQEIDRINLKIQEHKFWNKDGKLATVSITVSRSVDAIVIAQDTHIVRQEELGNPFIHIFHHLALNVPLIYIQWQHQNKRRRKHFDPVVL